MIVAVAEGAYGRRTAVNIKKGDIFEDSTDGEDLIVTKIVRNMVLLESQDGKRQVLTGLHALRSTSSYQKKGGQ